jgi:hypothetical protein
MRAGLMRGRDVMESEVEIGLREVIGRFDREVQERRQQKHQRQMIELRRQLRELQDRKRQLQQRQVNELRRLPRELQERKRQQQQGELQQQMSELQQQLRELSSPQPPHARPTPTPAPMSPPTVAYKLPPKQAAIMELARRTYPTDGNVPRTVKTAAFKREVVDRDWEVVARKVRPRPQAEAPRLAHRQSGHRPRAVIPEFEISKNSNFGTKFFRIPRALLLLPIAPTVWFGERRRARLWTTAP